MSLVKFRKSPLENLLAPDFLDFNANSLLNDRVWLKKMNEPALNIKEKKDEFEIELAAPGFSKKDFEVTIDNGCLNISAKKEISKEEKEEDYTRKEFSYNAFERSLQLPENVADEKIKAKYDNGILKFSLAKKEESKKMKPKVIEIS
ncbi:Hsp20/alpha crystallin family protein [Lutibacter sp. HS1-25]|uniref:Hsp20/alpha crystallin family protein n=1 Tax=Lutibacter sp. HS1-25 TaxID=2485000 RepID=UPI0010114EA7|nr:Hsp20/alpha crystallin family protein [Lutibacter sp. HS1-25]RXP63576.1 Hsp20/alpha crystallin family protein [Lutibacter sp. HS1-25]